MKRFILAFCVLIFMAIPCQAKYVSLYPFVQRSVPCAKTPCKGFINMVSATVHPGDTGYKTLTLSLQSSHFPGAFRVYFPPGTVSARISLFAVNSPVELLARYKQQPDNTNTASHAFTIAALQDHNCYYRERNVWLVDDRFPALSISDAGWLYVYKLNSAHLSSITVSVKVKLSVFNPWYNNLATKFDVNGDPWLSDDVQEISYHQPVVSPHVTAPVTNTVTTPTNNHTASPSITDFFKPVIAVKTAVYSADIGGKHLSLSLRKDEALLSVDSVFYPATYTDISGLVTLYVDDAPVVELLHYKDGLLVVRPESLILRRGE